MTACFYTEAMPPVPRYRLGRFIPRGGCYHIARTAYTRRDTCALHRHDFAEVFWVERGQALHHVNGRRQVLDAGSVVLIRPDDAHALRAATAGGFTLVNVAFSARTVDFIRQRYFDDSPTWIGAGGATPATWTLPPAAVPTLAERAERLSMASQHRLDLECFLLRLFQLLRDSDGGAVGGARPDWLGQAVARFTDREDFTGGPTSLAEDAGCTVAHLNRVVRHHYGVTTTELINQVRLERAAHRLRMRDDPIAQVALACGFDNLGYFYRRFTQRFGVTPRRYRLAGQAPMRGA